MLKEFCSNPELFSENSIKTFIKVGERKVIDINDILDNAKVILNKYFNINNLDLSYRNY